MNNFAITSAGIGEAMQRSASALHEAGNSIYESTALITAANSVIQNPEQVGTALKTLALRLRGAKVELEEAGLETDNMAESTSQLQSKLKALTHGKVDIMLDADTFKSTTQILREMSDAWEDMTDIERAAALELMGGKRQANILSSLIANFDTVEDVIETSMNSSGSAMEENEKVMDSIQGKTTQLTNSMQTLWNNVLNSDVLGFFIDLANAIVKIVDGFGLWKTALVGVGAYLVVFKKISPVSLVKDFQSYFNSFSAAVNKVQAVSSSGLAGLTNNGLLDPNGVNAYAQAVSNLNATQQAAVLTSNGLSKAQAAQVLSQNDVEEATIRQILGLSALNASQQASTVVTSENISAILAKQGVMVSDELNSLLAASATGQLTQAELLNAAAALAAAGGHEAEVAALLKLALGMNVATGATHGLDAALKALVLSNPLGWIMMAITVIPTLISLFGAFSKSSKESAADIAEAANEAIDEYNTATQTLRDHKKTIDEVSDSYERLSKGVDLNTNENISLTTASYEEYLDICNKIGDMFPELVTGFDEQGNAILSLKGNVDQLTQAYDEATAAANRTVIAEGSTIYKDTLNKIGAWEKDDDDNVILGAKNAQAVANHILEEINRGDVTNPSPGDLLSVAIEGTTENVTPMMVAWLYDEAFDQVLKDAGIDMEYDDLFDEDNAAEASAAQQKLQTYLQTQQAQLEASADNLKTLMNAYLGQEQTFKGLEGKYQSLIQQAVGDIESEFIYNNFNSDADMYNWVQENIVEPFEDPAVISAIDSISELQNTLSQTGMSYGSYKEQLGQYVSELSRYIKNDDVVASIKVSLGVDKKSLETSKNHIASMLASGVDRTWLGGYDISDEVQAQIDALSVEDLQIAGQLEVPEGVKLSWDELLMRIHNAKIEMLSDVGFSDYMTDFTSITESVGKYQEALEKLQSGSFTINDFIELIEEFPELAEGVDTSSDSFEGLSKNLQKAIKSSPKSTIEDLRKLREEFVEAGKSTKEIDQMIDVLENIPDDALDGIIEKYGTLADEMERAIRANSKLQEALSDNPNEGYETRGEAMKKMKELIDEGKVGSESQLWTIATEYGYKGDKNVDELKKYLDARKDWFVADDDGNYTFPGVENWVNSIEKAVANNEELQKLMEFYYDDATYTLTVDYDNKDLPRILELLSKAPETLGLLESEYLDLMKNAGLYFNVNWSDQDDGLDEFIQNKQKTVAEGYNAQTNGNFDYTKTAHVTKEDMQAGGWTDFEGDIATTYDQGYVVANYDGIEYSIVISCVTPEGDVISPEDLENYVNNYLSGASDILEADKIENGGKGLIINAAQGKWTEGQFELFNDGIAYLKDQEAKIYQLLYGTVTEPIILSRDEIGAYFDIAGRDLDEKIAEFQAKYGDGVQIVDDPLGVYATMYNESADKLLEIPELQDALVTYFDQTQSLDKDILTGILKEAGYNEDTINDIVETVNAATNTLITTDLLGIHDYMNEIGDESWVSVFEALEAKDPSGFEKMIVDLDRIREKLIESGYSAQQADNYIRQMAGSTELFTTSASDPLGLMQGWDWNWDSFLDIRLKDGTISKQLGDSLAQLLKQMGIEDGTINKQLVYLAQSLEHMGIEFATTQGKLSFNVVDLAEYLVEQGWTAEAITAYIDGLNQQIAADAPIVLNTERAGTSLDEVLAKAESIPEKKTTDYSILESGNTSVSGILSTWYQIEQDKTTNYTVKTQVEGDELEDGNVVTRFIHNVFGQADGTAHAQGTAHASGNWGAPRTETALTGELGPEMIVRGNKWFTVGENGAEFAQIKKGDIIFNH